jgi:hypothetical protein
VRGALVPSLRIPSRGGLGGQVVKVGGSEGYRPPFPLVNPTCPPPTSLLVEGYTPPQYAQNGQNIVRPPSPRSVCECGSRFERNTQPRIDTPF